jgi:hypothetical protein
LLDLILPSKLRSNSKDSSTDHSKPLPSLNEPESKVWKQDLMETYVKSLACNHEDKVFRAISRQLIGALREIGLENESSKHLRITHPPEWKIGVEARVSCI